MNLREYQETAVQFLTCRKRGLVVAPAGSVVLTNETDIDMFCPALVRLQKAHEHRKTFGSSEDCRSLCAGTTFDRRAIFCVMPTVTCHHCGKIFERQLNQIIRAKLQFCSKTCKSDNPDFNRIASENRGDAQRYRGEGKTYVKFKGRHLHRAVAERKLGRTLISGEIVHHIDGNKRNNDPENLCVITQPEHIRIHLDELKEARIAKNGFARGEHSGMAKLTESAVREMKSMASSGSKTQAIANHFGVSTSTILRVVSGKGWRHVQ